MLHFIIAGVGGGKTTEVMNRIENLSGNESEKITLIVPEQYSFTCQKNALAKIGPEKMTRVDVLSFTSLGEKLIGRPAYYQRMRLTDSAAAVLMNMALNDVKDELVLYKNTNSKSMAKNFLALSTEFKQSGVTPEKIRFAIENKSCDNYLKLKLKDIATIFEAYNKRVGASYFNPDDLLTDLLSVAELDAYLAGRSVFIDSFRGFTNQEYAIIEHILTLCKDVYISLCADSLYDKEDVTELFAKTNNTAQRIKRIAEKNKVAIANDIKPDYSPNKPHSLRHLEENIYAPVYNEFDLEAPDITLCQANSIYSEGAYVAATIKKLVRESTQDDGKPSIRFRDIAIIARNIDTYENVIKSALIKNGINIYEDYRKEADVSPVINIISAGVAAANSFDNDSIMRFLKTGLTCLNTEEISTVENYCYLWNISGVGAWTNEWTKSPDGFGEASEKDQIRIEKELAQLNDLRTKITTPILNFKNALRSGVNGETAAKALWQFIEEIKLYDNLKSYAKELINYGEKSTVLELERMWNLLIDIINQLEALLKGEKVTVKRLGEALEIMLSMQTVGTIPQRLDEVTVGSADRIRISSPKIVFVVGANEGVFPPDVKTTSSLTAKDRKTMEDMDIGLTSTSEWLLAEEKLIAYNALCCATEKLYVSCSLTGADGGNLEPSEFYNKIDSIFTKCNKVIAEELEDIYYVEGKGAAFEQFAKSGNTEFTHTAKKYFENDPEYKDKLMALERAKGLRKFKIDSKEIARELFGQKMKLSSSRIETYYKCPFMYFCKYGIKANPRSKAELDSIQIGNVSHYVLENLIKEYGRDNLITMDEAAIKSGIKKLMNTYYATNFEAQDDSRFLYLYDKIESSIYQVVIRLIKEFEQCSFIPNKFELEIDDGQEIEAYIPDGGDGTVSVMGKIDRVDIAPVDDKIYLRVIDYKTGNKELKLSDVVNGINMQMLIYLFALWKNGSSIYNGEIVPAGVIYYLASTPTVSISETESLESETKKATKSSGLILNDNAVITLMEKDFVSDKSYTCTYIPVATKKNKETNEYYVTGNIISLNQLKIIKDKIDKLILDVAENLHNGDISVLPYRAIKSESTEYTPCQYCDYKSVCGFEEGADCREYHQLKHNDLLKEIDEGGENNA